LIEREKEVFTMTRIEKVLLAVLVLLLTCSLVIVAGSSTAKTTSTSGKKLIKIWVNKDTGEIEDVKLGKDTGPDQDSAPGAVGQPNYQFRGIIFYTHSSPGCIHIITASGAARKVCW